MSSDSAQTASNGPHSQGQNSQGQNSQGQDRQGKNSEGLQFVTPRQPRGVRLFGGHSGVKATKLDTGVVVFDRPARVAGALTRNRCAAACVEGNRPLLPQAALAGLLVVSGNANCYAVGDSEADAALRDALASQLGASRSQILTATTGPIGVPLDPQPVAAALPLILASEPSLQAFADAILTTDTVRKLVCCTFGGATFLGIAKGSGMVHPDMATTIALVLTDADVSEQALHAALQRALPRTLGAVTVDRETSTNDSAFVAATGMGPVVDDLDTPLHAVLEQLVKKIARDGEGATRLCEVTIVGAPSEAVALTAARDVAASDLVKSAFFACDPNWGRLVAALGASLARQGQDLIRDRLQVWLQGTQVCPPLPNLDKTAVSAAMRASDTVEVRMDLGMGEATGTAWGCDLTYDYVRINAEAPLAYGAGGPVRPNLQMQTLTPVLKKGVLREALRYLQDFDRMTMVILVLADSPTTDDDLALLRMTGIRPIVRRDTALEQAVAVARDNHAGKLIVLSDDDGLRDADGKWTNRLALRDLPPDWQVAGLAELLSSGSTLQVLNGTVHAALIEELFTDRGIGTMVVL